MSIYQLRSYKRTFERFLFSRLLFAIVYISPIEDLHYSRLTPFDDSYPNDLRFETSFRFSKSQPSKHLNADFVSNLSANCALGYVASSSCDNYHRLGHSSECLAPTSIGEHPWNWQTRGNQHPCFSYCACRQFGPRWNLLCAVEVAVDAICPPFWSLSRVQYLLLFVI